MCNSENVKTRVPKEMLFAQTVRVRLPKDVDNALRMARKEFGFSMSDILRTGAEMILTQIIKDAIETAQDLSRSPCTRMRMIKFIRQYAKAHLALNEPDYLAMLYENKSCVREQKKRRKTGTMAKKKLAAIRDDSIEGIFGA